MLYMLAIGYLNLIWVRCRKNDASIYVKAPRNPLILVGCKILVPHYPTRSFNRVAVHLLKGTPTGHQVVSTPITVSVVSSQL
jgi:hypothetical protein